MKYLSFLALSVLLFSCTPQRYYSYSIKMDSPVDSKRLYFENDTMSIAFAFTPNFITFDLYNKLDDGIRINWDEISMSINGQAQRVVHKETGIYKVNEVQPPTTIPPKTYLKDGITTTDITQKVSSANGSNYAFKPDLYPTTDLANKTRRSKIENRKWERVTVFMPYYIRNVFYSKVYNFTILDVMPSKTKPKQLFQ